MVQRSALYHISVVILVVTTVTVTTVTNADKDVIESWRQLDVGKAASQFKVEWCRQRMSRYDWKAKLQPCLPRVPWEHKDPVNEDTDPERSFVRSVDISPAGFYSKLFLQSVTSDGVVKSTGGDFWRIDVRGEASVAADVYDKGDGTYEAVFLLPLAGEYQIYITLDYTDCKGIKDPPADWFKRGCRHGSFQPPGSLHGRENDYVNQTLQGGAPIVIDVEPPLAKALAALNAFKVSGHLGCHDKCDVLWDGYGIWREGNWVPYTPGLSVNLGGGSSHIRGQGVFYIYGDSLNRYFFESLSRRPLCQGVFRACYFTMTWVYALRHTAKEEMDLAAGGKNIDIPRILAELKEAVTRQDMDEQSALLLNAGVHLLKSSGFYTYQKLINGIVSVLKQHFRGTVIWKTTTSLQAQRELYSGCFRRFHTEQRTDLFNAYAMSAMCRAGFLVLDVYPLTKSYPAGTLDGVHYDNKVFSSAEDILEEYFTS
ncbi:uncharacterized protein LOC5507023 [Nematostella vectensis]|uniref:uncharacterized protein LOC5507023 n=1 Tax=Nematostella vectensis TaxID=45351 RepID=UPI0020777C01|nr:uncharacterized protein LOC5507023 [Nematostella vectensis]XP_048585792.1 uncharacterized protein LOC5507023 [Nematostella vectensis]